MLIHIWYSIQGKTTVRTQLAEVCHNLTYVLQALIFTDLLNIDPEKCHFIP